MQYHFSNQIYKDVESQKPLSISFLMEFEVSGKSKYLRETKKFFWRTICNFCWRIIFFTKKWQILFSLEDKKVLKQHEVFCRDLYCFEKKKKKMWNISHVYWRTTCELCTSYLCFHSNISFILSVDKAFEKAIDKEISFQRYFRKAVISSYYIICKKMALSILIKKWMFYVIVFSE